uniref:CSON011718 protein n=1 Tax=Culicoides sonorensis TaxID=179676 RepID=A0A336KJE1_CULSO
MASLLRGFRYPFGYFAGFARSLVVNGARESGVSNFAQPVQCLCGSFNGNGYATAAARQNDSLEKSLRRLDSDAKRAGRISRRDIEDVLEEIRLNRSATSSQSLLVIRCCGNLVPEELPEVRTKLVQEIWKTLNSLNIPMDISHYNALLRVYLENEYNFSPTDFLADLEQKGIEPNRVTYQRLIARYCQQGDIEGATKILEFMREKQLPVNENVFNALIMGHSQAGDMDSASGILQVMNQAGLEPSNDTYTTLLCGYAKQGNLNKIKEVLESCDKNEIYFLDRDMLEIVYNLAVNGNSEHVDFLLERIKRSAGYNQDAINTILRLINKGEESVAFKVLMTMVRGVRQDGEMVDTGSFFVKQLVKANRPLESIVRICKEFEDKDLNPRATLIALEMAVTSGNVGITTALLKQAHATGHPVRQHFFWPLLCSNNIKNNEEILDILRLMQNEFNLTPSAETVREYAIPNLKEKNYDKIINLLRSANISSATAATSVVYQALNDNNLSEAARIASSFTVYYSPFLYRAGLLRALNKTKDLDAYILLIRHIYENIPRLEMMNSKEKDDVISDTCVEGSENAVVETDSQASIDQAEMLGKIVYDAVVYFKNNRAEMIHNILDGLVKQGLSISNQQATKIQEKLGAELTPEISTMLGQLSTGELKPSPIARSERQRTPVNEMSSEQLERLISTLDAKGENTKGLKRQLVGALIREKNVEKLETYIKQLESEGYVLTSGVFAQITDMYATNGELEKAVETVQKIKEKEPDFLLDRIKAVKIAQLYLNADRLDDVLKFLESHKHEELEADAITVFNYNTTLWRLLNSIADKGKTKELKQVFDALVNGKYCEPNNVLLGPFIKAHLVNDDLEGALKTFEEICQNYRTTPWKNELACRLIQKENATGLQKLTDLSTDIHGEVNSLYDLVFSFVECGRIRQARKILETPGLKTRPNRINTACERYRQEGMVQPLEGLIEATKDLNHIDRMDIYYNLLLSYIKEKEPEKALGLWTKLQEEDIAPSDNFLLKLAQFLKENNVEVPFVVPETLEKKPIKKAESKPKQTATQPKAAPTPQKQTQIQAKPKPVDPVSDKVKEFRSALRSNNLESAMALKQNLTPSDKLSVTDKSILLEALTKAERYGEAKKVVLEMINSDSTFPLPRIFRFYLNKIANSGDVQTLEEIGSKLTPELKKTLSFDNRFCHASIVAGNGEKYLEKLENELAGVKNAGDLKAVAEKFPRGGAIGILERHPELVERFEKLAENYAKQQFIAPLNILWSHLFCAGTNEAKAEEIWQKYLKNEPRLMFQKVMHDAREKNDIELSQKLIEKLKESKITEGAFGTAYSCLIDVLVAKEKIDDAVKAVQDAGKTIGLDVVNRSALVRVKEALEQQKKSVPFVIPERTKSRADQETSSSSSSSSSDDEVTQKK